MGLDGPRLVADELKGGRLRVDRPALAIRHRDHEAAVAAAEKERRRHARRGQYLLRAVALEVGPDHAVDLGRRERAQRRVGRRGSRVQRNREIDHARERHHEPQAADGVVALGDDGKVDPASIAVVGSRRDRKRAGRELRGRTHGVASRGGLGGLGRRGGNGLAVDDRLEPHGSAEERTAADRREHLGRRCRAALAMVERQFILPGRHGDASRQTRGVDRDRDPAGLHCGSVERRRRDRMDSTDEVQEHEHAGDAADR